MIKVINTEIIRNVFKSMKYNMNTNEKCTTNHLPTNQHVELQPANVEVVKEFLEEFVKNCSWGNLENEERQTLLKKLASEIEKEVNSLVLLESNNGKNISSKHIREVAVPYLASMLRYYSNFCKLVMQNQKGTLFAKLSDVNCVSLLGYILGPALSAGYKVLISGPARVANVVEWSQQISLKIGFPEGTISYIPDDVEFDILMKKADMVYLFGTLDKFREFRVNNKKIGGIILMPTPVVIFDNADLDSACDSILNSTWNNQSIFNSTSKEVLVQETIYEKFVSKLKEQVLLTVDINKRTSDDTLRSFISEVERNGIEVFPKKSDNGINESILFVGGQITSKNMPHSPYISVISFRNIDEAITLANNNKQGLCASIWTENINLANQMAQKLQVSNVWINSLDIYSPDVSFTPLKFSGNGYFGGIQGLNEFLYNTQVENNMEDTAIVKDSERLLNAISSAKKGHASWSLVPRYERMNKFFSLVQFIETNKHKFTNKIISYEWLNQWRELFFSYIQSHYNISICSPFKEYNLNVCYCSRGVLAVDMNSNIASHNKKLLVASLLEGNSLIIVNGAEDLEHFYNEISKQLPSGVLNVVPSFSNVNEGILGNSDIDTYFIQHNEGLEFSLCDNVKGFCFNWHDIYSKVTYVKNVWSSIGQGILK